MEWDYWWAILCIVRGRIQLFDLQGAGCLLRPRRGVVSSVTTVFEGHLFTTSTEPLIQLNQSRPVTVVPPTGTHIDRLVRGLLYTE